MLYACIGLFILVIVLTVRLIFLNRAIRGASRQMAAIEQQPDRNRQLKALTLERDIEELFTKINDIYLARQQERIIYQRRETQIRREIENISHDLRTPLTSIIGYVDLLQNDELEDKEKEEYLDIIKRRARVLQGFIQDFYELSRIEGENYPLLLENVPVQTMLAEAAVAYYHEFEKKKITVELELEENTVSVIADKIQLNRVFNNLLQNALKYADHIFVIKQITANKECILQFKNEKGTMTERELNVIFDRFYCGDLSRSNNSTGLGLTISKLLVEKMKGSIHALLENDMFIIEIRFPVSM
ncbi:MAG TPA: HAMP domain-containing sensor histidine kinase [Mobilitalea sp.]|nr:HAMP domain-containing sensor histidine kinase [Mobilitalea sp.]